MGCRDYCPEVTVNGLPLAVALREIDELRYNYDEVPDALELALEGAFDDRLPAYLAEPKHRPTRPGVQAARALIAFELDGIRYIGSRRAVLFIDGEAFDRGLSADRRTWKRHRPTQYRPREMFSFEFFRLITGAN